MYPRGALDSVRFHRMIKVTIYQIDVARNFVGIKQELSVI
jgi:hypothetical protein